jgi:hypothetical protein
LARVDLATSLPSATPVASPVQNPFLDTAGMLRTKTYLVAPYAPIPDEAAHDILPPLGTPPDTRSGDGSAARLFMLMPPPDGSQGPGHGYGQFDPRGRFVELVRDTLAEVRLAAALPDVPHSRTDGGSADGDLAEKENLGAINHAVPGQNAQSDPLFLGAGRAVETALSDPEWADEAKGTPGHEPAGRLVALDEAREAFWSRESRLVGAGSDGHGSTTSHDLLAPRFAFDAEALFDARALGAALGELLSEADEWGTSLLGFLTDPTSSTDLALVAGVAVAGFAYRHWRGGPRREEAEARAMLAARFVTGPASLRLGRRTSG